MKKYLLILLCVHFIGVMAFAQEGQEESSTDRKPVRSPWESGALLNHQTSIIAPQKALEFMIQHRFGTITNGSSDIWGIMSPGANIRLGLNYSLRNNLMVGYGLSTGVNHDVQLKYTALNQTRDNAIPVSVTLYGNMGINAQDEEIFGGDYEFTDRLSYFSELIIGRKFCNAFSLQASVNFSHYNRVDDGLDHDKIGIGAAGRVKFSPQSSFIFEWGLPLTIDNISEQLVTPVSRYHLSLGCEVSTGTHVFQIFVTNSLGIVPQDIYMNNASLFDKDGIRFGFNMTRLWFF